MSEPQEQSTVAGGDDSRRKKSADRLARNLLDLFLIVGALVGFGVFYALAAPYLPSWARTTVSIIGILAIGSFIRSRAREEKK